MDKLELKNIYSRNDELTKAFIKEYSQNKQPVEVSFRELLSELKNIDRHSHLIHTYPAKLLLHIPYFFLNNEYFSKKGDIVLDPFCGTGTVLLETILSGKRAMGADANPVARLIAEVKTTFIEENKLFDGLKFITSKTRSYKVAPIPYVVNCDYWFSKNIQLQLAKILRSIKEVEDKPVRDFFLVCLSNCVKKVSYADPHISVPVKLNPNRFPLDSKARKRVETRLSDLENVNVIDKFISVCHENIVRIGKLSQVSKNINAKIISSDARALTSKIGRYKKIKSNSVQLIITSPPYAGAQKYIRSSSLSLGWLEIANKGEMKNLEKKNIGRESYKAGECKLIKTNIANADDLIEKIYEINPKRAFIVSNYLIELIDSLRESIRVLKKGGYFVIIVGNNMTCNMEFNTQDYITQFIESQKLKLLFKLIDDIKSYGLMTKRNKTADIISREWILVFQK